MEQPGSPTPSDTPDEGASGEDAGQAREAPDAAPGPDAPNDPSESANESSGDSNPAATLDEMYLTLGHLVAAHDLHRSEAEQQLKKLSATAQDLQKQREEALAEGDHMKYANAIRGLSEVAKIAEILQNDAEDELRAAPPEHQDSDGSPDERTGDGDPGSAGDEQPLARDDDPGVGERGAGSPDGEVGGDDDSDGGSGGRGAGGNQSP